MHIPGAFQWRDKVVHLASFAILAYLFWHFVSRARGPTSRTSWLSLAVLVPYAAIDEYTQQFVGRYTDLADWIANVTGIVIAVGVLELRRRSRAKSTG